MLKYALLTFLEAKPGKENELAEFLKGILVLAEKEVGTATWYVLRPAHYTFLVFATFADEKDRGIHLAGSIASAITTGADQLIALAPRIESIEVLAAKLST